IADDNGTAVRDESNAPIAEPEPERVDFSQYNPVFRFSADVPTGFAVEYVPQIKSINIYDSNGAEDTAREQSQIFIRYFEASSFLTLQTVDILNREETEVHGHDAVRYEIAKKAGVADFPHQPSWRNAQHKLTDIRFSSASPSLFYVFSYRPEFPQARFELFIQSLSFHNDMVSFVSAIDDAGSRITKKPFGIYITAENSPVQPERFSGYHTGTDYETFASEQGIAVPVFAICGGELASKRTASGYGGVLVQACEYEGQSIRVVYGHVALASVAHGAADYIAPGEQIALLGEEGKDTDNERKHLHVGIKKGADPDIRGYVASEAGLEAWMDPESL
ncbi:MAG: M23 family metallopeptidase, partial [Parcubacteria group bacterium]|nr:M23 family metallopeptidase [Parcubacteria group bacterium]